MFSHTSTTTPKVVKNQVESQARVSNRSFFPDMPSFLSGWVVGGESTSGISSAVTGLTVSQITPSKVQISSRSKFSKLNSQITRQPLNFVPRSRS